MAQTFFPITPVDVTLAIEDVDKWTDVDVSACLGADAGSATGVLIHVVNDSSYDEASCGLRKNGSTDDRKDELDNNTHSWALVGIDSNDIFEAYCHRIDRFKLYLVGYTKSGVTFLTNGVDKTPGSANEWVDMDCSSEAPSAIGLIFETFGSVGKDLGCRKEGSTDDRTLVVYKERNCFSAIIGCDASQVAEGYRGSTTFGSKFYLIGYVTDGCTFNTNATDLSLDDVDSWIDLSSLPSGAVMGFIEITSTGASYNYGLRKNGTDEDIYQTARRHAWATVGCDGSQLIEGKIVNVGCDFFLVGYATEEVAPPEEGGAQYIKMSPFGIMVIRG